ncbi:Membrane-bound lytic murein transglycosylase B precursor [Rhodovulum sp. P5]|uniref:lytic murein transglycosylase n=1 Tax=Rhodovulum sp. P5 TaxID=1564506 RepID=UPI0009C36CDA|nr:lytic murein transglycosylase [Rhodovulum sp. P5]ARE39948.1 Membrane-bound lytic murein transglycosylase B precursor [Rhodovulum sp. P5]
MTPNRRTVLLGLATTALSACGGGQGVPTVSRAAVRAVPNPAFDAWVAAFRSRALARGIAQPTVDRAFRGVGFLPDVVEKDRNQTEFTRSLEDYLAIAASDERIAKGRDALSRHGRTLAAIEARYGVDKEVVAAIWGLESRYGERRGDIPVISALSTLAFDGRRGPFYEKQLFAALKILQRGDITPERMTGSWAGAMGHTQFIPTSFEAYAVDFTGDGRRDIWSDDPTDALASTAAYLQRSGWQKGRPWGMEVRLPAGFNTALAGRGNARAVASWRALGVTDTSGRPLPDHGSAAILIPQGRQGPAFAAFRNFSVILRYNNAENYGIGVGHLADRIAGKPPLKAGFPPDAKGLTIDDRKDLQRRLTALGFDTQGTDGVIGPNTETAIRAYQARAGLPVDGEPSLALLRRLR